MSVSNAKNSAVTATQDREIVITRIFDAPRELVWDAWTDPKKVVQWWGPRGFTTTIHEMDVRPGGVWRHTMHGPDGTDYPNKSVFIEVVKPERIVYSHGGGKKGGPGVQFQATWTLEAQGGRTKVTLRMLFQSAAELGQVVKEYGAIEGGNQTLDRLGEQLAKMSAADSELVISRVFDAPRELVWKAWTDPKQLAQWWGPKGFTNPVCELDVRPGGAICIHMRGPDGTVYPTTGVYQEVVEPERLVFTERIALFVLVRGAVFEVLNTVTFAEQGEKTIQTLRARVVQSTTEAVPYLAGMETGWTQSLDRLIEYLARA
jgi:uncharacterized protein YndB with AHSA1/START domain